MPKRMKSNARDSPQMSKKGNSSEDPQQSARRQFINQSTSYRLASTTDHGKREKLQKNGKITTTSSTPGVDITISS
jgi:O-acetylhomoserine/O-acetylserine sulfhydrylase-like pyridoxal-dependent enzyme